MISFLSLGSSCGLVPSPPAASLPAPSLSAADETDRQRKTQDMRGWREKGRQTRERKEMNESQKEDEKEIITIITG